MKCEKIKKGIFIGLFFIYITGYGAIASAQLENENLPDREGIEIAEILTLHAAFKTGLIFDTNIYLSDKDEKFDMITLLNPSVGLEVPFGDNRFSCDYDIAINLFGRYSDEDYVSHRLRTLTEINLTDFKITLEDIYRNFSDRAGSEDTNRIKRQNNDFRIGVAAQFDQLGFNLGYTLFVDDFRSKELLYQTMTYDNKDSISNILDTQLSYRFLPKTSLLFEGYWGFITYDSSLSSDSYFIETLLGLKGDLRDNLTVDLKAGFRYQDYDKSELTEDKDFISAVARGGIEYYLTDDDIINLNIERSIYESTYNEMNYYNVNFLGFDYTHLFNNKIKGGLFGSYQLNLYPDETIESGVSAKRYDHLFGGGCILRYDIRKWISVQAKYEYKQRESRFSTYNYIDNAITLEGTIGF